jgi:TatD DNase family protein
MPYRGKRNEPSYLFEVVKKIAEIKKLSIEDVSNITTQNANKLFRIGGNNHET